MSRGLAHSTQSGRHPYAERGFDLYETPASATNALANVEQLPHWLWEPASGRGAIVNVLRDRGHAVIATDIHDYGFPLHFVADFLTQTKAPVGCDAIITNPPYQIATEFTRHALNLVPRVYMLLRLAFYESIRRTDVLEQRGLARVHVFRKRLPMMHRDQWAGRKANSGMSFAWFTWIRGYNSGPTIINRISWER